MIARDEKRAAIERALRQNPACVLLGPRQSGKTTLAREIAGRRRTSHLFDLETAVGRARLAEPETTLGPLTGLVVIDEIQRQPELFTVLRPLLDRVRSRTRFLLLGSAAPSLVRGVSESLAGRVGFVDLSGFDLDEVGVDKWRRLWLRGGFPRSYLARTEAASSAWRTDLVRTFLERDIPSLGIGVATEMLRRFWTMVAHYHGQIWSGADLGRSLSLGEKTVRSYLDLLTGAYVVRQLPPWFENLAKRQYKSPKVYIRDSGLLHTLLSIRSMADLEGHPKYGASWEGFAIDQVLAATGSEDAFYWGSHAGAELDLLLFRRGKRYGVEFKAGDAPRMTRSLHIALADLRLDRAFVVYPGKERYRIEDRVEALPLTDVFETLRPLSRG